MRPGDAPILSQAATDRMVEHTDGTAIDLGRLSPNTGRVTRTVNVHEAKTHLSRLLEAVEGGEEIVIARAGKPVARLVLDRGPRFVRQAGSWRGRVVVAEDFDATPAEVVASFSGGGVDPAVP